MSVTIKKDNYTVVCTRYNTIDSDNLIENIFNQDVNSVSKYFMLSYSKTLKSNLTIEFTQPVDIYNIKINMKIQPSNNIFFYCFSDNDDRYTAFIKDGLNIFDSPMLNTKKIIIGTPIDGGQTFTENVSVGIGAIEFSFHKLIPLIPTNISEVQINSKDYVNDNILRKDYIGNLEESSLASIDILEISNKVSNNDIKSFNIRTNSDDKFILE